MAAISGSTTAAWSSVLLGQVDFASNFVTFGTRLSQLMAEFRDFEFSVVSATSTLLVVDMFSGGRLSLTGTRLTTTPVIRAIEFKDPPDGSGEVIRATGTFNGGVEVLTSASIGSAAFSETVNGSIQIIPTSGNYRGTLTSLVAQIGSATVTFRGTFSLSGNVTSANIAGSVTSIAVMDGGSTINMTGLTLSLDGIEAALAANTLATVNDLFSYIGSQLAGNDTITYTNDSGAGMSFYGGAGNDTITISGSNGDTLVGGAGNDLLTGGSGEDTVIGDAGNDQITMLVTSGHVDTINGGADTDTLILSGVVPGNQDVVVDLSQADQVVSIGGVAEGLAQTGVENLNALGISGFVTVMGSAGDNVIIGSSGDDTINGGAGNDRMSGGLGNDTYRVDSAGDVVTERLSAGWDKVFSSIDYTLGGNLEDLELTGSASVNGTGNGLANILTGNSGANILRGGAGNDTLNGGTGNDALNGGTGNDALIGGTGNDTYVIGAGTDVLAENLNEGTDLVQSSITHTLGANFENLTLTGVHAVNGTGNDGNNILTGNSVANVLAGGAGNDTLNGGGGNDRLDGGLGDDAMVGGAGNDTYIVDSLGDTVTESLAGSSGGTDLVQSAVDFILGPNVERLMLTGSDNIDGTGNTLNNILTGNSGNNILDGGAGLDRMAGGDGNDVYIADVSADVAIEAANAGTDLVQSLASYRLGVHVENLTLTGTANISGTGNTLDNVLTGNSGNNHLTGGAGNDTLVGNAGNDVLIGGSGQDTVTGGAGNDQVTMLVTAGHVDTIDAGIDIDTLVFSGIVPDDHRVVVDLSQADQVLSIGGVTDALVQSNFENLNASRISGAVTVAGSAGDNVIIGSQGNDTINGGDGNDTMIGGQGNDTYRVDSVGDVVTEGLSAGSDKVFSSIEYTLGANLENLELTGSANLNGRGNTLGNSLTGNSGHNILYGLDGNDRITGGSGNDALSGGGGNDRLDGGLGDDAMDGGAGNDTYIVDSLGDTVTESLAGAPGGTDLVQSAVDFILGPNVERLMLTGSDNIDGTGNTLNNILTGNSGNNQLLGLAGNDTLLGGIGDDILDGGTGRDSMNGGAGDDTYVVDVATDVVTEAANSGIDTVQASIIYTLGANVENLTLTGTANLNGTGNALSNVLTGTTGNNTLAGLAGADTLNGGAGNDVLNGGLGQDTINGGAGNDRITMLVTAGNMDTINAGADIDTLVLSGTVAGNQEVVVNLSSVTDQVVSIGGVAEGLAQTDCEHLNASGISGFVTVSGSAVDNVIIGSSGSDVITGEAGDDTLIGGAGNDVLEGGAGNDTLTGGGGNDTYVFGLGDGQDSIQDNGGSADKVLFGSGADPLDLVFSRQANDLRVAIQGTSDHVTIQNWYASSANRTETIEAGNGQALLSTQVEQLIQAMAAFTTQTGLSWDQASAGSGTVQQQAQFQGILAASWQ